MALDSSESFTQALSLMNWQRLNKKVKGRRQFTGNPLDAFTDANLSDSPNSYGTTWGVL